MFKKFIKSYYDIDEDVLENIKSEETLREEHKHINSLLQQNGIFSSKFLMFVVGLIVTGIGAMLLNMYTFFIIHLPTMKNLNNIYSELESLMYDIGMFSIGFYALFLLIAANTAFYGSGLKNRKKIVIGLLDKTHEKNKI